MKKPQNIVILLFSVIILTLSLWGYGRLEAYCYFYPAIDTRFALGFSEQAFNRVVAGMSKVEVEAALGKPLSMATNKSGLEEWAFTDDGKCTGNFTGI